MLFDLAYLTFAAFLLGWSSSRSTRWGARVFTAGAVLALGLPFRTDRPGADITWHGALHALGYAGMMVTLLVAMAMLYPGLVRGSTGRSWALAPLALLLLPPAWLLPDPAATSNYLFFAVPFALLAAMALRIARGQQHAVPAASRAGAL